VSATATKTVDKHIAVTPGVCGGKPRISGHRIRVEDIAVWHEQMGMSVDQIASEFELSLAEVHAALAYYFDHQAAIDKQIEDDEKFVEEMRRKTPSLLKQDLRPRLGYGRRLSDDR